MTPKQTPFLLAILACLLAGCRVTHTRFKAKDGILLREVQADDGATTSYRLYWGGQAPKIHRTHTSSTDVASLGVNVRTVTPAVAEQHGIRAFEGVFVDRVVADSPAARSGLRPGDVILRVGPTPIASREQLEHVVQAELSIGEEVEVELGRAPLDRGAEPAAQSEARPPDVAVVLVTPGSRSMEVSKTDVLSLEHSPAVLGLTGMQVAGLSSSLGQEIYGADQPLVLVAQVTPGSPAYRAGLRSGDRVLRCDGRGVRAVADLRAAVRARAALRSIQMDDSEEVSVAAAMQEGSEWGERNGASGPLRLDVDGPLGPHSAEVEISERIGDARSFKIPIVVDYRSDVDTTRFSFLDFIFQFGWNYRSRYLDSATRASRRSRYFSLFPFGMFEVKTDPKSRQYTFLWFITVGSGQ